MRCRFISNALLISRPSVLAIILGAFFAAWLSTDSADAQSASRRRVGPGEQPVATATRPADPDASTLRVFKLKHAAAESVAKAISAAFKVEGFRCQADAATNCVAVGCPARLAEQVEELLLALDAPPPASTGKMVQEMIPLPSGNAEEVAEHIRQFSGRHLGGAAKCVAYPEVNIISVEAPEDSMRLIRELVSQLAPPPVSKVVSRVFFLRHMDAGELADVVSRTVEGSRCAYDKTGNRLVVRGAEASLRLTEELIEQLDVVPASAEARKTVVVQPRYADAGDLAATLDSTIRHANVSVQSWKHNNSVLITGSEGGLALAKSLIENLDQPPMQPRQLDQHIRVFRLGASPDDQLSEALDLALGEFGEFSVDPARKLVIVSAKDPSGFDRVAEILKEYDTPTAESAAASTEQRIRLVWLVTDLKRDDTMAPEPPADMKPVADELARIGVTNLRLAAQAVVNATDNEFKAECSPQLTLPFTCRLSIVGKLRPSRDAKAQKLVELQISAVTMGPPAIVPVCELRTTVAAPPGHNVVLGVTPIGEMTSVFVLQLMTQP